MGATFEHIGILTWDREAVVSELKKLPGAGEPVYVDALNFDESCVKIGKPFTIKGADMTVAGVAYEIIELVPEESEGSYMMKRLHDYGEGLHHIAFEFDNLEEWRRKADELMAEGYVAGHYAEIPFRGKIAYVYYLDAPKGGMTFELKCMV